MMNDGIQARITRDLFDDEQERRRIVHWARTTAWAEGCVGRVRFVRDAEDPNGLVVLQVTRT